ncbi:MAG TPA: hypothetical protein VFK59_00760 [Actinomycetota bacterium]|nr:hypothetical protein [Actinomycetota bacterium]
MIAASPYLIVFRVLHILFAIAWGGTVFLLVFFLQPTAKAVGPAAGPFMRELLGVRRLTDWVLRIAWVAIIAGGFLYWHDLDQYPSFGDFLESAFGLWLTIGAVLALIAVGIGMFATAPTLKRMLAVGGQVAQAGDAPPPELVKELGALQARGRTLAKWNFTLVSLAAFAMSTARYW